MAPGRRSLAGRESRARAPPCSMVKAREGMDLLVAAGGDAVVCFLLRVLVACRNGEGRFA